MRLTADLQKAVVDLPKAVKTLADEFIAALAESAFQWIQTATSIIPVWSGASHATFLLLAREIGFTLSIDTANNAPRRVNYGLNNSSGSFSADATVGRFEWTYETKLPHLVYNESHNANAAPDPGLFSQLLTPGPYQFQAAGEQVLLKTISTLDLPPTTDFIKVTTRRVR